MNLYFIFNVTPQSNDECLWVQKTNNKKNEIYFDFVKFEGVTWKAGIRDGDKLLEINDIPIKSTSHATLILDSIKEGYYAKYKVQRGNKIFETKVYIKKLVDYQLLSFSLFALFWLLVGVIVIKAKPGGIIQVNFFRIGILFSLFSISGILKHSANNPVFEYLLLVIVLGVLWLFASSFLPVALINFFWIFPTNRKGKYKNLIIKILLVLATLEFISQLVAIFVPKDENYMLKYHISYSIGFLYVALIVGLISLFISYTKIKNIRERNPIFIILVTYALGIAALIYSVFIATVITDTVFNSPAYYAPIVLLSILPIAFGYSIFKYSLLDVSEFLKKALLYGIATLTIAFIYFALIYFLGTSISSVIETDYQGLIAAGIFIVFAIIFQSAKDKFQNILTYRIYPEQFAYQEILLKFSNEINTIIGLDNILDETTDTLIDALRINQFGIMLSDGNNRFLIQRTFGFANSDFVLEYDKDKLDEFIDARIYIYKQVYIDRIDFEKLFPSTFNYLILNNIYTIVPLKIKSKIIGLLLFGLKYSGSQFAGKDLEILNAVANQIAVSIENARLYNSEAEKLKFERDFENAAKIQKSLLPKVVPQFKGATVCGKMIPALQVGGDYFDIIKISETKFFIIVGDVSGKGLAASYYMTQLQTMMRIFCAEKITPKEILIKVNKIIYEEFKKNWFITISLAFFDTEKKEIIFARAGHTPLVAVLPDNKIKIFKPQGIGVGLDNGKKFDLLLEEEIINYQSNWKFVFYSDGLTEEMNAKKEIFSEEKLYNLLIEIENKDCNEMLNEILEEIKQFRGNSDQSDDITLVIASISE